MNGRGRIILAWLSASLAGCGEPEASTPNAGVEGTDAGEDGTTTAGGEGNATGVSEADGASSNTTEAEPPPTELIFAGTGFIDAFFGKAGVAVVHADGVDLVGRMGEALASYVGERVLEAAAFDGTVVVVTDAQTFTVLDLDLMPMNSAPLEAPCVSVAILDTLLVCESASRSGHLFHTYGLGSGSWIAVSAEFTLEGGPMRALPGLDEFITVNSGSSPSDYHLFELSDTYAAAHVNESAYHEDFVASLSYAIIGKPATHVASRWGTMYRIDGVGCDAEAIASRSGCFVEDGDIGTLSASEGYADLREVGDGTVVALRSPAGLAAPSCGYGPCTLAHIDVGSSSVLATASVSIEGTYEFVRPDPSSPGAAVIGADSAPFLYDAGPGFSIAYVEL